jgi:hypothetical protein
MGVSLVAASRAVEACRVQSELERTKCAHLLATLDEEGFRVRRRIARLQPESSLALRISALLRVGASMATSNIALCERFVGLPCREQITQESSAESPLLGSAHKASRWADTFY